jgi:DnaD/phage-associated family protein
MGKIIKVQLEDKFTQVPNETAKLVEKEISLQSLGLLVNIMSYAQSWELHKTELYKRYAKNKETSVSNAWDELVKANYIIECKFRDGKKWDYNYFVRLLPFSEEEKVEIKKQVEAQTSGDTKVLWTLDFQDLKMKTSKPRDNKERTKEIRTKEIKTSMYVSSDSESLNLFNENYQPTKHEQKKFQSLIDKYGEELSMEAIKRTLDKGKKENVINYITGILKNWSECGLKTVVEVESHEAKYREEKTNKAKRSRQKKERKELVPQSLQDQLEAKKQIAQAQAESASAVEPDMTPEELHRIEDIHATMERLGIIIDASVSS